MVNYIVIGILVLIIGGALLYVYKAKKSGKRCIGCPSGGKCGGTCTSCNLRDTYPKEGK